MFAIAWRNVWRNARRSLITMSALGAGVAGLVAVHSYRENINAVIIRDITAGLIGHMQVHALGYQEAPNVGLTMRSAVQVEAAVQHALPGARAEKRVIGAALAGTESHSAPVTVLGLEVGTGGLYTLATGHDLQPGQVLLGKELALELELGKSDDELILVSQAADGSVANDKYTVAGTFTSSSAELDANAIVMSLADAQSFFSLGEGVHQLVVRIPSGDSEDVSTPLRALQAALDVQSLEALSWSQMLPELKSGIESKRKSHQAMDFVVFLIVGLGIFNAMTMSVFERTRELGVLASLGTRPRRLLGMIVLEALMQAGIAFVVGVAIAAILFAAIGSVDLTKLMQGDVSGTRMPSDVPLHLVPAAIRNAGITTFATALIGALLPAIRAARLQPVEALRAA